MNKIFKRIWKSEGFLVFVLMAFLIIFGLFCWSSEINNGQKEEMREAEVRIQDFTEKLDEAIKENLALKDEKRFAFQPEQIVVKTEPEEKIQEEIASTIETNEAEADWAGLKAQLDALELGVEAAEAQIAASQAPPSDSAAN
jgi:hypothetical protein